MNCADAGQPASRRDSSVSLGLVGVPSLQEPAQTADTFEFDVDPSFDYGAEDVSAQLDAFWANLSVPNGQSLDEYQVAANFDLQANLELAELPQVPAADEQYGSYMYDPTDLGLFPVQQTFGYPEPRDYYSGLEEPYFYNSYEAAPPSIDAFDTLGLTALPGSSALTGYEDIYHVPQQYDILPESWILPTEAESFNTQFTGYVPLDASVMHGTSPPKNIRAAPATTTFTAEPIPSSVIEKRKHCESQISDSDSDSDSDGDYRDVEPKTMRKSKYQKRKERRRSSLSSACISAGTPVSPVKYNAGEKPKKDDSKSWIRINANTEGDTRTAKINNWKNKYEYKPLPLGSWTSGKHVFQYTQYENVDFLTEAPLSTRKIREYIMNYPCSDQKRLTLWIQRMPADQGRRYGSQQHSKCAFRDCPVQKYITGTISTGEYRVAFDEKHFTYGDKVDPYDCTAYAHLYCMEQFLDFEQVCQVADVRVDTRIDLPLEPNGKAAFSMVDVPARAEIERFVKLAARGKLRTAERWQEYPVHGDYQSKHQKPHEHTLTYLAHCMYEEHQDDSHKKQAALRRVTVSQRRVHLGDLEMSVADKRIQREIFGRKKKNRNETVEDYYDKRIRSHIERAERAAARFLEEKARGKKRSAHKASNKKKKKRNAVQYMESDDDIPTYPSGSRRTRQKKHRVNYLESPVEELHQYDESAYAADQATPPVQAADMHQLQTYVRIKLDRTPPIDPAIETPYGLYAVPATPKLNIEDFDNFPACEDDLPEDNLEKLLSLERRQSCVDSGPMGILKSTGLVLERTPRRAVFGVQPVTDSKEYGIDDPPSAMFVRRSGRIRLRDDRWI